MQHASKRCYDGITAHAYELYPIFDMKIVPLCARQYIFIQYLLKCTRFKIWEFDLEFDLGLRRAVVLHAFPIRLVCVAEARLA